MKIAGYCLAAAAIAVGLAWVMMPDAGTNDADAILRAMAESRIWVYWSAIVQLAACAAFAPAVMLAAQGGSRATIVGASVLAIGAMGMAADAVYHQAANQMAASDVATPEVRLVLARMQTEDIRTLLPLMLAYPIGVILFTRGLARQGSIPAWIPRLAYAAIGVLAGGIACIRVFGVPVRIIFLTALGLLSAALAAAGLLARIPRASHGDARGNPTAIGGAQPRSGEHRTGPMASPYEETRHA